jgi:ParB family chromosome partitioning protein
MAKRKLGRGLDMLISRGGGEEAQKVLELDPAEIEVNPEQPRKLFAIGELESLKASIERDGVLQPILVRRVGDRYQLVAGERRLRAAQDLPLEKIPVVVVDVPDDRLLELALIENIHREDLNPIELAQAYRQLMERKSWTQEALSDHLSLNRSSVANSLRLLDLPENIQTALVRGQIDMSKAKILLSVSDQQEQRLLFEKIGEERLTVRELETERALLEKGEDGQVKRKSKKREQAKRPYLLTLEEELGETLGTRVRIRERNGKGVLSIDFYSQEDFERLRARLVKRETS